MTAPLLNPLTEKGAFHGALLRWYALHQRDLPWRKTRDPYKIMVSEFMLQQTRVETVLSFYGRFLKAFPSLPRLARAPRERVLRLWAGMGYYARARNLHAAARTLMKDFRGKIPAEKEALLALPGFGPYTAGAVASIAFNRKAAALDGNVRRVLGRLSGLAGSGSPATGKKRLESFAEDLVPEGGACDFNQALMDLGAMVCLPARPKCPSCPARDFCLFRTSGRTEKKPAAREKRKEEWLVALVENHGRYLLVRKEGGGLLAGLWQFPTVVRTEEGALSPGEKDGPAKETLRKHLRGLFGVKIRFRRALPHLRHPFTHILATLSPYLFSLAPNPAVPKPAPAPAARWVSLAGLSRYPVSRAMMKVAGLIDLEPR